MGSSYWQQRGDLDRRTQKREGDSAHPEEIHNPPVLQGRFQSAVLESEKQLRSWGQERCGGEERGLRAGKRLKWREDTVTRGAKIS